MTKTAFAKLRNIRISPRKLDLQVAQIRGLSVERALDILSFSRKRIALDVKKTLASAIANAENNHDMDVDYLVVDTATVGQGFTMKRFQPRAKGRAGKIKKYFSHLTIVVREEEVN